LLSSESQISSDSWLSFTLNGVIRFASSARDKLHHMKDETMKKANKTRIRRKPEMLNEYDFSKGVRCKYAKRYAEGSNVVVLSPDVAEAFPDSESVNEALRVLLKIARQQTKKGPA